MLRSLRIFLLSTLSIFVALPALASGSNDNDARNAREAARAEELAKAIADCDRGAAIPLDADIRSAPVQYGELFPANFDLRNLKALQAQCLKAMLGAPKQKRLALQWLRVTVALGEGGIEWLVPQVQAHADVGSAEAHFLLYRLYHENRMHSQPATIAITRDAAINSLVFAAEQGHLTAMMHLSRQYLNGPLLRRNPQKAVQIARRIESMPPQGKIPTPYEEKVVAGTEGFILQATLENEGFTPQEYRLAYSAAERDRISASIATPRSALLVARALRLGLGVAKDPVKARKILEEFAKSANYAIPLLADMLAHGEGGPTDGKRALALLRNDSVRRMPNAEIVLADLLLEGKIVGRQPREAMEALARSGNIDAYIRLAGLLLDYPQRLDDGERLVKVLTDAALAQEPGAGLALARLKLSDNGQFTDIEGARTLLASMMSAGDRQATWLVAASQYSNLDSTSYQPSRRTDGLSDAEFQALLTEGFEKKEPEAYLLAAKLTRRGVLYPQDDKAATNLLISAANLGSVEAMVLLGRAHDQGLGTPKNPRERLHAWRMAVQLGSLRARTLIANAFTFDSFDKLITLDEGITGRLALYFNGRGRLSGGLPAETMASLELAGLFSGRASEAGSAALAEAVMNAFRQAPAGLQEQTLIGIGKALPDEIRIAIETRLKQDGFYKGQPEGYFGPEVRLALADWVEAKGPYEAAILLAAAEAKPGQSSGNGDDLDPDLLNAFRDKAFKEAKAAKSDKQKTAALKQLNLLARYGDLAPRWALLRNYHQARIVRNVVSADEITRYGLDIMVAKPAGMEKPEFEFIFVATQIFQDGQSDAFGAAAISAIRDDPRLQDPLTLGGIMGQFIFAPGTCDAILAAGQEAGIAGLGADGCDEASRTALIAFARKKGQSGAGSKMRASAIREIRKMQVRASK